MAPSATHLSAQLRQIIWYHLDNDLLDNALFHAGRLQGIDARNHDNIHLLALCQLRVGQLKAACESSRSVAARAVHIGCSYVFAQACLGLKNFTDGIVALQKSRVLCDGKGSSNKPPDPLKRQMPDAAAAHCLLGKLYEGQGDQRAIECYTKALRLNPFMWDAFERLCDTGTSIRPSSIFKPTSYMSVPSSDAHAIRPLEPPNTQQHEPSQCQNKTPNHNIATADDPFISSRPAGRVGLNSRQADLLPKANRGIVPSHSHGNAVACVETPPIFDQDEGIPNGAGLVRAPSQASHHSTEPPNAPLRKSRIQQPSFSMPSEADTAKIRASTGKTRSKDTSESTEAEDAKRLTVPAARYDSSANPPKRPISGIIHQAPSQQPEDLTAAPSGQRRSNRLFNKTPAPGMSLEDREQQMFRKARATGTKGRSAAASTVGRVVSGNRKPIPANQHPSDSLKEYRPPPVRSEPICTTASVAATAQPAPKRSADDSPRETEATLALLELMSKLGNGRFALSQYDCETALQHFQSLPPAQRDTPWVLAHIGKAYFEQTRYAEAEKYFLKIRHDSPFYLIDMAILSTLQWHLKKDYDLAFLAHELIDLDRLSPEAWCTLGNSFSLQREHDQAIRCFKRATQLRPDFAYGYTLQGHEHISNEEYDKASLAYRKAVSADTRHYNGWYGLGRVHEQYSEFARAEQHYRFAADINPHNAVLFSNIGVVLDKQGKGQAALAAYSRACQLTPRNTQARFRRAKALQRLGRLNEALEDFLLLKDQAPDDANAHFALGRIFKGMGEKEKAIRSYLVALNVDPKAQPVIKEALDGLDVDDYDDDDEEQMAQ